MNYYHYTTEQAMNEIVTSRWLEAASLHFAYGPGVYVTDIPPVLIANSWEEHMQFRDEGAMRLRSAARQVEVPGEKLTHYLELDLTGLSVRAVSPGKPHIFLLEEPQGIHLDGRLIHYGATYGIFQI